MTGEVAWRVPSLSSPPTGEVPAVEVLSQYDAVSLFVDRARRARPSFVVNDDSTPAVAQICNRLDGIPLAVELAAARCRHLSSEQIAAELDDRFQLLTGGPRFVLPVSRRSPHRSSGASTSSTTWSAVSCDGWGCSPDRSRSKPPKQSRRRPATRSQSSTRSATSSTRAWFWPRSPSTPPATGCSRRSVPSPSTARDWPESRDAHAAWWSERLDALRVTGPTDEVIAMVDAHHEDLVAALSWAAHHDVELGLRLLWPLGRAFQGTGRAGDAMAACDELLATSSAGTRHPGCAPRSRRRSPS